MWQSYKIDEAIKITEMFSLLEPFYDKDFVFKGEKHNFWECVIVLRGDICASADERVYRLKANEIIFHKPLELHKFYIDNPYGAQLLIFSFSMEGNNTEFFKNKVFNLNSAQIKILNSFLDYLHTKDLNSSSIYSQLTVTYIYQLFLSLMENEYALVPTVDRKGDIKTFYLAVGYMNNRIGEKLTLSDIAKQHNTSETSLKRIFKKYAGMGVHEYFISLKINSAIKMLLNGESVSTTGEKLGFSSQGYFSLAFKRETGFSPCEFIKQKTN